MQEFAKSINLSKFNATNDFVELKFQQMPPCIGVGKAILLLE
jgi:hypothetical protein